MQGSNTRLYQQFFCLSIHDLSKFVGASCWRFTAVFNSNPLNFFISNMLETTASTNTDFFKELIRVKKQKIAVNNAITDIL